MFNKKQETQIHMLKSYSRMSKKQTDNTGRPKLDQAIEDIVNLVELYDKVIDHMCEHIVSSAIVDDTVCALKCDCDTEENCNHEKMLKCTKSYFVDKVKKEDRGY